MAEAIERAGKAEALALALEKRGVVGPKGRYGRRAVSSWASGKSRPPADVLIAAAQISDPPLSIDQVVFGLSLGERLDLLEARIRHLEGD
jgi:hypothetical protein